MESEVKKKKHATAVTSRESYKRLLKTRTFETERFIVFEAIQKLQPVTSRSISIYTKLERTNVTRAISGLLKSDYPVIKIAGTKKCIYTSINVSWYALTSWKDGTINFKQ